MKKRRAIILVIDALGIGAMPDAVKYGDDATCNSLVNTARLCGGLHLPHLLASVWAILPESGASAR